jgi:hypothetical protein
MAIINSVTWNASVFVKAGRKWLTIAKALAYYTAELITAVKSFMVQATGERKQQKMKKVCKSWNVLLLKLEILSGHKVWGLQKPPASVSSGGFS